jgi:hypothetical protein
MQKKSLITWRVGVTRSGRAIFCVSRFEDIPRLLHEHYCGLNAQDRFDIYCVFEYLTIYEIKKNHMKYDQIYQSISKEIFIGREIVIESEKAKNNITTSIDVANFGRMLANVEFK